MRLRLALIYHQIHIHASGYLVKGKGPDRVGRQLHCIQQSDLDEAVGLCAAGWPVLIAFHLQEEKRGEGVRHTRQGAYAGSQVKSELELTKVRVYVYTEKERRGAWKQIAERFGQ